jgi:hypothetical protein
MDTWLTSLHTSTAQEGFELAIKLSRMAVKYTQPDMQKLKEGREQYAENPEFLIQASSVVALNFQTVAHANNFWKSIA